VGGGLGPVSSAESVVHVDVAQLGHLLGQLVAVLLLALVHATVFQQHHLARGDLEVTVHPVVDQLDLAVEQLGQAVGDGGQGVFRLHLAFGGAAQVGGDHHRSAFFQGQLDGRDGGADAGVVGDAAGFILGDVQVGADEDACRRGRGR